MNCNSQNTLFTSSTNFSQPTLSESHNDSCSLPTASNTSLSSASTSQLTTTDEVKSRLEEVILGQGSARSELMRRKGINTKSNVFNIINITIL